MQCGINAQIIAARSLALDSRAFHRGVAKTQRKNTILQREGARRGEDKKSSSLRPSGLSMIKQSAQRLCAFAVKFEIGIPPQFSPVENPQACGYIDQTTRVRDGRNQENRTRAVQMVDGVCPSSRECKRGNTSDGLLHPDNRPLLSGCETPSKRLNDPS